MKILVTQSYGVFSNLSLGAKNIANFYLHFKQDIYNEKVKERYCSCSYGSFHLYGSLVQN